ncbi:MAG: hypothetical protein K9N48_07580 [Verrucomicrobia bacterium]|nr:hypothetical protein [Verrucomicrobiota bacterium]MCF7708048.1 hypothetical protein [Verrucomicrobiota bacterium]
MKTLRKQNGAAGNVLVTALVMTGILGITLFSYLSLIQTQQKVNYRVRAWKLALANAEAGVEEALAHLNHSGTNNLTLDQWSQFDTEEYGMTFTNRRVMNSGRYDVSIVMTNYLKPAIKSVGYMPVPLSTNYLERTVFVTTEPVGLFTKALLAEYLIDMNGNNLRTDSYDSSDPNYSTGGRYDPAKAKDNGDIASTAGIVGIINVGNADIYGRVATGPGGSVTLGPNGSVGDEDWHNDGNNGIKPGWFSDDVQISLDNMDEPFTSGYIFNPSGGRVGRVRYDHILDSGNYKISNLSGSVLVRGDANLIVSDRLHMSGHDIIELEPNASLNLYLETDAKISGQGIMNPSSPQYMQVIGLPGCESIEMSGNSSFSGVVYAPDAVLELKGGGRGVDDFQGAAVVHSIEMRGHYNVHFDENLKKVGPIRAYVVSSWAELH